MESHINHGKTNLISVDTLVGETLLLAGTLLMEVGFDLNLDVLVGLWILWVGRGWGDRAQAGAAPAQSQWWGSQGMCMHRAAQADGERAGFLE